MLVLAGLVGSGNVYSKSNDRKDMSTSDSILNRLNSDITALIQKAKTDIKTLSGLSDSFTQTYTLNDGQLSPDGKWKCLYKSQGTVESKYGGLYMTPKIATAPDQTYSCLVLSTKSFKNFQLDCDMRTTKQIRTGSQPNTWETAWLFWRFTDEAPKSNHHYYFTLKTNGYEFGKKDNAPGDTTPEQQIFLKTGSTPAVKIGTYQHIIITAIDFHFVIKVDGVTVVDMIDTQVNDTSKMSQGLIGMYTEDASTVFDNVKLLAN